MDLVQRLDLLFNFIRFLEILPLEQVVSRLQFKNPWESLTANSKVDQVLLQGCLIYLAFFCELPL